MKKLYSAPTMECLAFFSNYPISDDEDGSNAWNEGELGWT